MDMRALCINEQPLKMDVVDHPIRRNLHRSSSGAARLLNALTIVLLLTLQSSPSLGQVNARSVSITLVARLESLSVAATVANETAWGGHDVLHHVLVTTSWAVSSNRTTIRVTENGTPLFSQAPGQSNRPGQRIDPLNLSPASNKSEEANAEIQPRRVVIFVQAL